MVKLVMKMRPWFSVWIMFTWNCLWRKKLPHISHKGFRERSQWLGPRLQTDWKDVWSHCPALTGPSTDPLVSRASSQHLLSTLCSWIWHQLPTLSSIPCMLLSSLLLLLHLCASFSVPGMVPQLWRIEDNLSYCIVRHVFASYVNIYVTTCLQKKKILIIQYYHFISGGNWGLERLNNRPKGHTAGSVAELRLGPRTFWLIPLLSIL